MIFSFLVSFLSFAHINVGGELYISELLLAAYLIFSTSKIRRLADPFPKWFLSLGALWLLSQILSDVVNDTPSANYLRGWAAIIFFLVDFAAIYLMAGRSIKRARLLLFGWALGKIFQFVFAPTEYATHEPWKWALATPLTLLLLMYLDIKKINASLILLATMFLGMLHIYLNARSLGGRTLITGFFIYVSQLQWFHATLLKRLNIRKFVLLTAGGVGIASVILVAYQWSAESGYLPKNVTEKYEMTKSTNLGLLGLILGGRVEILASSEAVLNSPILGHGSWAEDRKYALLLLKINEILGTNRDEALIEQGVDQSNLIPTHSYLMQAWVWAGLLGAIFWFAVLRFIFQAILPILQYRSTMQAIAVFFCISVIWDILFSPFGSGVRVILAIKLLVIWMAKNEAEISVKFKSVRP